LKTVPARRATNSLVVGMMNRPMKPGLLRATIHRVQLAGAV